MFGELLLGLLFLPNPNMPVGIERDPAADPPAVGEKIDWPMRPVTVMTGLNDFMFLCAKTWEQRWEAEGQREFVRRLYPKHGKRRPAS